MQVPPPCGGFFVNGLVPTFAALAALTCSSAWAGQFAQNTNLSGLSDYILKSEYNIRSTDGGSLRKSANRAQNLRFTYYDDGIAVEPRDYGRGNPKPWEATLRMEAYGKSSVPDQTISGAQWQVNGNAATVQAGPITIEYNNDTGGLRQNFLLLSPPPGSQPLQLNFEVQGTGVASQCDPTGSFVYFTDASGQEVARYTDLHASDANGQELAAAMVQSDGGFAIIVEDQAASYPVLVDPLVTQWAIVGDGQTNELFGWVVADPGDLASHANQQYVYPRLMIGAPAYDNGADFDVGAIFVYYAFKYMPTIPTWEFLGDQTGAGLGYSCASSDNLDGSGNNSIVVSAPDYSSGGNQFNGRVYVFPWNSATGNLATTPITVDGTYSNERLGLAVVGFLALNDLGYDCIAASGCYQPAGEGQMMGMVNIYQGSSSGLGFLQQLTGATAAPQYGWSLAAGDLDGDGIADLAVGMASTPSGNYRPGGAEIYYGTSTGFNESWTTILQGENNWDEFGYSLAVVGDACETGYNDLLIGAPGHSGGKAYLYEGSSSGVSTTAVWTQQSSQSGAMLGASLSGGVDVHNGSPFLIIGAPNYTSAVPPNTECGAAYFYGVTNCVPVANTLDLGFQAYDRNGFSVVWAPVVGYALSGFVVGAPYSLDANGVNSGGVVTVWEWK